MPAPPPIGELMIWMLKNKSPTLPNKGDVGDFGVRRSFYHHPGLDIYCDINTEVQAMEDGIVVCIDVFTGPNSNPPSPWWFETYSILIEGKSGVLGYCEIKPVENIGLGSQIKEGQTLGYVTPVLKKDKGNGVSMLHLEYYTHGTKEHVTWELDKPKPIQLLNPRILFTGLL